MNWETEQRVNKLNQTVDMILTSRWTHTQDPESRRLLRNVTLDFKTKFSNGLHKTIDDNFSSGSRVAKFVYMDLLCCMTQEDYVTVDRSLIARLGESAYARGMVEVIWKYIAKSRDNDGLVRLMNAIVKSHGKIPDMISLVSVAVQHPLNPAVLTFRAALLPLLLLNPETNVDIATATFVTIAKLGI